MRRLLNTGLNWFMVSIWFIDGLIMREYLKRCMYHKFWVNMICIPLIHLEISIPLFLNWFHHQIKMQNSKTNKLSFMNNLTTSYLITQLLLFKKLFFVSDCSNYIAKSGISWMDMSIFDIYLTGVKYWNFFLTQLLNIYFWMTFIKEKIKDFHAK